ncbi:MAG: pilus assembly protein TadG-related protein [Thiohalocapsa sp.]
MLALLPDPWHSILPPLARDEQGVTVVTTGLALTMLLGFAGLAVDVSAWQSAKRNMQGAADQAAYSAAIAAKAGGNGTTNAKAITAQMGYVAGQNNTVVSVNNPPTSGSYTTNNKAWEVIITKPQPMWFASLFMASAPSATARAVAIPGIPGQYCLLELDPSSSGAISLQGSPQINAPACNIMANSSSPSAVTLGGSSKIIAQNLATVGDPGYSTTGNASITATLAPKAQALKDPYSKVSVPASSTWGTCQPAPVVGNGQTVTITAGCYTGNLTVPNSGKLILGAGTYYIDRGSISTNGGTITSQGAGVTIVLTSATKSSWSTINLSGNSNIDLTAQSSGTFSGLVVYADRRMPFSSTAMALGGGSNQKFAGDMYFPSTGITFGGNATSTTCARLIAYSITLSGNSTFQSSCSGLGTADLSGSQTYVAE